MKEKPISHWSIPLALTGILFLILHFGNSSIGQFPSLGQFWSPFSGFWRNAETGPNKNLDLNIPELHETVSIVYDKRGVPRIFAQNTHDLFLAQGFVLARDRLWQMEIQARSAAGRLSEILGPSLFERDRFNRRMGLPQGAEKDLERIKQDADSWEATKAYSEGVNAFIQTLKPESYPLEYKLLDYTPEPWTPLNTALLIKNVQWMLSAGGDDLPLTNTLAKFGVEFVRKYYPSRERGIIPSIPAGMGWDFMKPTPPKTYHDSNPTAPQLPGAPFPNLPTLQSIQPSNSSMPPQPKDQIQPSPGNGSNNFVISGARTSTGSPILANDPHLDLGLPSLWYEVQLTAPGMSAYGVTLPGAPGILIGFNQKIAWGLTNGQDDVFDWYRITFRDTSLTEYKQGKFWKPIRKEIQAFKIRNSSTLLDTIFFTHHGPIVLKNQERPLNRNLPTLHALRWLALEPTNEVKPILAIMKSSSYNEFSKATESFHSPSQNFAFASVNGDIGLFHQGQLPKKWIGQGRFVMDGANPDNDWSGWIPKSDLPKIKNPPQGWLFSANNTPTDSTYPHYLGNHFIDGERAARLTQLVSQSSSITLNGAFEIMLDDFNIHASEILPTLIRILDQNAGADTKTLVSNPIDSFSLATLEKWDFNHRSNPRAAALFELWWKKLYLGIWQDEFGDENSSYQWPSQIQTRLMIQKEPNAEWYNDISTPQRESLPFLVHRTFREACAIANGKTWSQLRPIQFKHLSKIKAFSKMEVSTGGCETCVNAMKTSHGPSWRMAILLDKLPHGQGIYPGGQSGNPGSPQYDNFIEDWAAGRSYEISLMPNPGSPGAVYSLQLVGK